MSIVQSLRSRMRVALVAREKRKILRRPAPADLPASTWPASITDPTSFYLDCYRYFHQRMPAEVREHRAYFTREGRGFGEDAFHVEWFLLFRELRPKNFLEIGVYRGQTLTLAALLARANGSPCDVHGISPFSSAGDSVSRYATDLDYYQDTLKNFDHFRLPHPTLLRAYSTDPGALAHIASRTWDLIYIDGNHDYDVARQDWEACARNIAPGGVIVLDDSALNTAFRPPWGFSTAGHPGPSRLATEIDSSQFRELLRVGHNRAFQRIA